MNTYIVDHQRARETQLEAEDKLLQEALVTLQEIVDRHVQESLVPTQCMTSEELQAFAAKLTQLVEFEFQANEALWQGLVVSIRTTSAMGALLTFDEQGYLAGYESMSPDDVLVGMIQDVGVSVTPEVSDIIDAEQQRTEQIPINGWSLSVVLLLHQAQFFISDGSETPTVWDLSDERVGYPLMYGTDARIVDAAYLD